jgi:large subunit ribosomal protein L32
MAVQQNKKSPSKRGMHRSHNALNVPGLAVEPTTGEVHLRHHISPTGFYRGRKPSLKPDIASPSGPVTVILSRAFCLMAPVFLTPKELQW